MMIVTFWGLCKTAEPAILMQVGIMEWNQEIQTHPFFWDAFKIDTPDCIMIGMEVEHGERMCF